MRVMFYILFVLSLPVSAALIEPQSGVPSNLIEESQTLRIQNEGSIQEESKESERIYGLRVGQVQGESLLVNINRDGVSEDFLYDLGSGVTEIGARFGIYPFQWIVDAGLEANVNYFSLDSSSLNADGSSAAKLHVVGIEALLSLKHRLKFAPWMIPQIAAGGGIKGLFQRGYNDENTSTSQSFSLAQVALNFDLSQILKSDLDWGFFVDAKRNFGSSESGVTELSTYSLGLNISL